MSAASVAAWGGGKRSAQTGPEYAFSLPGGNDGNERTADRICLVRLAQDVVPVPGLHSKSGMSEEHLSRDRVCAAS
jgi:hypothetical protein